MAEYKPYLVWVLIIGGLLWGYEGFTGEELQESILGVEISNYAEIIVGVAAALVAYLKLTTKAKAKR